LYCSVLFKRWVGSLRVGVEGTSLVLVSTRAFYSSRLDSYNETQGPTCDLKAGRILCSRTLMARVANNIFNNVDMPDLMAYHATLSQQCDVVLYNRLTL
jgi:hypothetical protein